MNITLKQLRAFCALYELKSFTAAARATFVTQSAISKLCAELEAELGQPLFERSTRSVVPCDGAAEFYAYAQEILGTVREAERCLADVGSLQRGRVAIATSPMMMIGLLGPAIAGYHRRHPGISLDLFELSTDETLEYVRQGRADFGVVSLERPVADLTARVIARDGLFVACAPAHEFAGKARISWPEISRQNIIALRNVYNVRRSMDTIAAELGLSFRYAIEAGMLASVLSLAEAGLGIAVVPGYACGTARQLGLAVVPIEDTRAQGHELWLVERPGTRYSRAAQAFLDTIRLSLATGSATG